MCERLLRLLLFSHYNNLWLQDCGPGPGCPVTEVDSTLAQALHNQALPPLRAMSVVYSRRLKKELQEIQIEQADPAKRAAGAFRHSRHPVRRSA